MEVKEKEEFWLQDQFKTQLLLGEAILITVQLLIKQAH